MDSPFLTIFDKFFFISYIIQLFRLLVNTQKLFFEVKNGYLSEKIQKTY